MQNALSRKSKSPSEANGGHVLMSRTITHVAIAQPCRLSNRRKSIGVASARQWWCSSQVIVRNLSDSAKESCCFKNLTIFGKTKSEILSWCEVGPHQRPLKKNAIYTKQYPNRTSVSIIQASSKKLVICVTFVRCTPKPSPFRKCEESNSLIQGWISKQMFPGRCNFPNMHENSLKRVHRALDNFDLRTPASKCFIADSHAAFREVEG